jgi:hypothetical protein
MDVQCNQYAVHRSGYKRKNLANKCRRCTDTIS